jgi:hypothetical protein
MLAILKEAINVGLKLCGSDLTFSNRVKSDGSVETVQLRTWIKWEVKSLSDRCDVTA